MDGSPVPKPTSISALSISALGRSVTSMESVRKICGYVIPSSDKLYFASHESSPPRDSTLSRPP